MASKRKKKYSELGFMITVIAFIAVGTLGTLGVRMYYSPNPQQPRDAPTNCYPMRDESGIHTFCRKL